MNQSNRRGTPASTPSSDGWPCREPPGVDSRCPSPPNWVAQRCCGSDDGGAGKGAIQGGGEGAIQGRGEGRRATVQEHGEGTVEGGAVRLMRWRGKARPVIRVRASSGAIGFGWSGRGTGVSYFPPGDECGISASDSVNCYVHTGDWAYCSR